MWHPAAVMDDYDALGFVEKIVALLGTGRFTASYKFAVLTALIDVIVEGVDGAGQAPRRVSGRRVGERVMNCTGVRRGRTQQPSLGRVDDPTCGKARCRVTS